ncbi:MAG TPA: hypothetical protein VNQ73_11320 [Ilumatobacter sp.]|nr:hypothetical protein [Ilumatobacter sp.]
MTDDQARRASSAQQREAVDAATSEHLLDGSLRDAHGEIQLDPDLGDDRSRDAEPDPQVAERHRCDAASAEAGDEQAADETLGTIEHQGRSPDATTGRAR